MKILILGDIHGEWQAANRLISKVTYRVPGITHIIQVGDLGDGWPIDSRTFSRWNPETDIPIHWLDGNHENHDLLETSDLNPKLIYQPRGSVLEIDGYRMMFMGGATSIDKDWRLGLMRSGRAPKIWWEQESIKLPQFYDAKCDPGPIHALFSHEKPDLAYLPFIGPNDPLNDVGFSDRVAIQGLIDHFEPRFSFFGHYHQAAWGMVDKTEWTLCPIVGPNCPMRYVIWDGKKVERFF